MSVCVRIRTNHRPSPDDIFDALVNKGESIIITSPNYPCVKLGNYGSALRGIEINEEDNGLEVRICIFASIEDHKLFAKTIMVIMELSGARAFYEDDDDDEVLNPIERFDDDWISTQCESTMGLLKVMALKHGKPFILDGMFLPICIGPHLFKGFNITMDSNNLLGDSYKLQDYLINVQWTLESKTGTDTSVVIQRDDESKLISTVETEGGAINNVDYIIYADLLGLLNSEGAQPIFVPFEKIRRILPQDGFRIIDEYQFERIKEIKSREMWKIIKKAALFEPDDIFHDYLHPGEGYDEIQNTLILMWNPAESGLKMESFVASIPEMYTTYFSWRISEYEKAKCGDRFFLIKCGEGKTGIVMSGICDTRPFADNDWNGLGTPRYSMEMVPNVMINPESAPMISTKELKTIIPSFDWDIFESGRILPPEDAMKLESLWQSFLEKNRKHIDGKTFNAADVLEW